MGINGESEVDSGIRGRRLSSQNLLVEYEVYVESTGQEPDFIIEVFDSVTGNVCDSVYDNNLVGDLSATSDQHATLLEQGERKYEKM